jgi:hypothetical protein
VLSRKCFHRSFLGEPLREQHYALSFRSAVNPMGRRLGTGAFGYINSQRHRRLHVLRHFRVLPRVRRDGSGRRSQCLNLMHLRNLRPTGRRANACLVSRRKA